LGDELRALRELKRQQAYLGHRSINSTTRYAALAPGRFKNIWGKV
jgi:site-specific recombinase XerD